jgi:hypothetical protein
MTTFVLRLQPPEPTSPTVLRGVVDEIATGVTRTFGSTGELLEILFAALRSDGAAERRRGGVG